MIDLALIGIGTGNPDHVTLEAVKAIRAADVILLPLKGEGKADLADVRRRILAEHRGDGTAGIVPFQMPFRDAGIADYTERVAAWHLRIADAWHEALRDRLPGGQGCVALLVWGDPSLYDSTLRIAGHLGERLPLRVRVIPGLTSIQLLTAAHAIPLNGVGRSVTITTGRRLGLDGWPAGTDTIVVMLDEGGALDGLDPAGIDVWWAAYLGLPGQITVAGPLVEVRAEIARLRAEARARHGWIMDTYLLRREPASPGR